MEGNHEAIIEPKLFDLVQVELAKRSKKGTARYSGVSIFSNKIKCAECGSWYGSKVWHSNDKYRRVIYRCNHKFDGDRKCETPHVTEEEVKAAFVRAMNEVITERDEIITNIKLIRQPWKKNGISCKVRWKLWWNSPKAAWSRTQGRLRTRKNIKKV